MAAVAGVHEQPRHRALADDRPVVGGDGVLTGLQEPVVASSFPHVAPERHDAGGGDR